MHKYIYLASISDITFPYIIIIYIKLYTKRPRFTILYFPTQVSFFTLFPPQIPFHPHKQKNPTCSIALVCYLMAFIVYLQPAIVLRYYKQFSTHIK